MKDLKKLNDHDLYLEMLLINNNKAKNPEEELYFNEILAERNERKNNQLLEHHEALETNLEQLIERFDRIIGFLHSLVETRKSKILTVLVAIGVAIAINTGTHFAIKVGNRIFSWLCSILNLC